MLYVIIEKYLSSFYIAILIYFIQYFFCVATLESDACSDLYANPTPFPLARCHHKLYERDPSHRLIIYCVDRAGIIQEVMTPPRGAPFRERSGSI